MKNFYYVIVCKKDEKYLPYCISIGAGANLLPHINSAITEIIHPCATRKEALELVTYWRECYRKNGTLAEVLI